MPPRDAATVLTPGQQDEVLDRLYVDLGLTRVRPASPDTAVGAGIEPANDNADPNLADPSKFNFGWKNLDAHVNYITRAQQRGVTTSFLSPLTQESWMGNTTAADVADYGEWLMSQVRRAGELGVRLPYLSVANEPSYGRNSMSAEFVRDVIKNVGPRLRAEGFDTMFVTTDDVRSSDAAAKAAVVLAHPVAREYVGAVATHLYDEPVSNAGFDPMENLSFPTKVYQAAKVATRDAEAAGQRFLAAKFALQRRVLNEWSDYALRAEQSRIQRENLALLGLLADTATGRVRAGGAQQDLLRTDIEYRLAQNRLADVEAGLPQARARLNAMLGRPADAPLPPPSEMPAPRSIPADDAALIAAAAESNPELIALSRQVQGRRDALELARMQYIPDFNPFAGFTGSVQQFIGLAVSLPTVIPEIRGMIKESRADLKRVQAMYRQTGFDRQAELVAALYALRNSERQAAVFAEQVQPAAERVLASVRQSYAAGRSTYLELIEGQRTVLEVRLMLAEARAAREKNLADLEALAGVDVETLAAPVERPPATTRSAVEPAARSDPFEKTEVPQ